MHPVFHSPVSCQPVAITVWVGFLISIPTLRQSLFHCKPHSTETFGEAGARLFPGSLSPEQKNNGGREQHRERLLESCGRNTYAHIYTRAIHIHKDTHEIFTVIILLVSSSSVLFLSYCKVFLWRRQDDKLAKLEGNTWIYNKYTRKVNRTEVTLIRTDRHRGGRRTEDGRRREAGRGAHGEVYRVKQVMPNTSSKQSRDS